MLYHVHTAQNPLIEKQNDMGPVVKGSVLIDPDSRHQHVFRGKDDSRKHDRKIYYCYQSPPTFNKYETQRYKDTKTQPSILSVHSHFLCLLLPMNSSPKFSVFYTFCNDHTAPQQTTEIPIHSSPQSRQALGAAKIQSTYKAHLIRNLYKKISSVDSEANRLQHLIQRQETVDSIRSDEREKLRMNEALMGLLLRLDSVPGNFDPSIREARRKVSRRIVGLQEILDGICGSNVDDDEFDEWGPFGHWKDFDKVLEQMEEEICRERGGDEMEKFCAQHLGFRCLQRFLRD